MRKIVNLYAGPGAGKSTMATGLFSALKFQERNIEYISEYAKDATWENRGEVVFRSQEYIFGKQFFRMERVADKVDFMITDSPILLSSIYMPKDYHLPSLRQVIYEADNAYESIDFFIKRTKKYIEAGRSQKLEQAIEKDHEILEMLERLGRPFHYVSFDQSGLDYMLNVIKEQGW